MQAGLHGALHVPNVPLTYIAWSEDHLAMYVEGLKELLTEVADSPESTRPLAAFLVKTFPEQKSC